MSISTLRRQVKNVAYNFSDAQVKVREATSNDPWGPTTALMSEIADLTHNPMSFTEIMSMLWKRLNDHGKNWRHVYKSLVLLDYLIKCGSEKVAQQCRENIYSIETLRDFQHIEDNRDQGLNVREKAKQMVSLLNDEERLRNERARFLLTRKRFIQNGSGISSDGTVSRATRRPTETGVADSEFEEARPSSLGEEEMQLQIAMALSREECEKEEELRKGDAIRLQIALEESKRAISEREAAGLNGQQVVSGSSLSQSALDDLLSLGLGQPTVNNSQQPSSATIPANNAPSTSAQAYGGGGGGGGTTLIDPWSPPPQPRSNGQIYPSLNPSVLSSTVANNDPWGSPISQHPPPADALIPLGTGTPAPPNHSSSQPSGFVGGGGGPQNDPWAAFETSATPKTSATSPPMMMMMMGSGSSNGNGNGTANGNNGQDRPPQGEQRTHVKTPETFLGENSSLVNLDNLMGPTGMQNKSASNPFVLGSSIPQTTNPFAAQQRPSPSLHEMIQAQRGIPPTTAANSVQQPPPTSPTNPFALL